MQYSLQYYSGPKGQTGQDEDAGLMMYLVHSPYRMTMHPVLYEDSMNMCKVYVWANPYNVYPVREGSFNERFHYMHTHAYFDYDRI